MEEPGSPPPQKPRGPVSHDPTAAGVGVVLTELTRTVKPEARPEGETMVLEYGKPMKWFVVVLWLLVLGGLAAMAVYARPGQRERALAVLAIFPLMLLLLHLEFFHVSIRYDGYGLKTKSPWRRNRTVPWEDITGITFESGPQWYAISTTSYGKVRVPFWLSGIQSLLAELERRGFQIPAAEIKWQR